jgi:NAD(P)-dependent dehydrogenase (short-subunit alcohol dehydrogenase family)
MMTLINQHVVVVGGSSGIGLEVARLANESGAHVTIMGRSQERLNAAAQSLGHLQTVVVDTTDEESVKRAFASIKPPDHVYVAAASFVGGSVLDGNLADFRSALEARLWGSVHVVRAAAKSMHAEGASFVFTGGLSTDRPVKGAWATAVATAAAEQLARSLALELAPVRFNAIAPGWTDTPMWDSILGDSKQATFATVGGQIPVGRVATASEAALAVLLLMANKSINGEVLHVDGGHRLV